MLHLILQHRFYQRTQRAPTVLIRLLNELQVRLCLSGRHYRRTSNTVQESNDFYIEVQCEYVSRWPPFMARACPSEAYQIYKKGTCVRIDSNVGGTEDTALGGTVGARRTSDITYRFSLEDGARICFREHNALISYRWHAQIPRHQS